MAAAPPAQIIPPDRMVNWQGEVGVRGGIPYRTNIFCNLMVNIPGSTNVAYGDGNHDDYPALADAIRLCPANQVIYLPAGAYNLASPVVVRGDRNFITIRGAGPDKTVINGVLAGQLPLFYLGNSEWVPAANHITSIVSGCVKDSTNMTVADATGITNSMLVHIDQLNDDVYVTAKGAGGFGAYWDAAHNGTRNLQELVRVTAVNGSNITFWPPLSATYSISLSPRLVQLVYTTRGIGVEDLSLYNAGTNKYHIYMDTCENCWIRNVNIAFGDHWDVMLYQCLNCELRDSFIHEVRNSTVNGGYGLEVSFSTDCLIENNIFWKLHNPLIFSGGTTRCVVGYNYFYQTTYSDPTFQIAAVISCHGGHPTMNLFEGNIGNRYHPDFYWGSSGAQTVFRNWWTGVDPDVTNNRIAIALDSHAISNNVMGNILGSPGINWVYDRTNANRSPYTDNVIWRLGYPNGGNNNFGVISSTPGSNDLDSRVLASLLRHGNYDYSTRSTIWNPAIPATNLPPSLYLTSKPSWWGSYAWPSIGPDCATLTPTIPAERRLYQIMQIGDYIPSPGNLHVSP